MTDHLTENQRFWDAYAPKWIERGEAAWRAEQPYWGIWATPESELALIPSDLAGRSVVELGCGTGYVSRWFEQRGASVTAVDLSRQQLATAKRFAAQFQSEITLIQSNAEATPLPNRCADIVVSEYGAAIWCDPYRWIPEAARLLVYKSAWMMDNKIPKNISRTKHTNKKIHDNSNCDKNQNKDKETKYIYDFRNTNSGWAQSNHQNNKIKDGWRWND